MNEISKAKTIIARLLNCFGVTPEEVLKISQGVLVPDGKLDGNNVNPITCNWIKELGLKTEPVTQIDFESGSMEPDGVGFGLYESERYTQEQEVENSVAFIKDTND
ncbi:hypothetical protein N9948_01695 [bacterium]|nr:hypothetical protein [bacterium]